MYKIYENQPKIPILSDISDTEAKTVQTVGFSQGWPEGPHKRPWGYQKTISGVKKKGAKSILGSNYFKKVGEEIFLFLACTLLFKDQLLTVL